MSSPAAVALFLANSDLSRCCGNISCPGGLVESIETFDGVELRPP